MLPLKITLCQLLLILVISYVIEQIWVHRNVSIKASWDDSKAEGNKYQVLIDAKNSIVVEEKTSKVCSWGRGAIVIFYNKVHLGQNKS